MDRRNFLFLAVLAVAGKAAERVFPFRVYSIPNIIALPKWDQAIALPETVLVMRVHIYSADLKIDRGSFLATVKDCTVIGMIPSGVMVGDVLVPEVRAPLRPVADIVAHASLPYMGLSDKRTGVFLNLARPSWLRADVLGDAAALGQFTPDPSGLKR